MTRRFTKILAALALLVTLAIPMGMRGQTRSEVTYTFSEHYSANTTLTDVAIAFDSSITGTFGKGTGSTAPQYYTNGTAVRWYGGNTLNITASNATISEIVLTYTQKNKGVSTNVGTYNHDNGTWSGSASSVTFTVETGSGHNRVSAIKVTYSASGGTPTCATPTFSPEAGTYTQAQNVSISCATEGATIHYTTNGDEPTTNSTVYTAAINVSTNTTIKAIAAAEGYNNSAAATAEYTILEHAGTLEDPYTVADARAAIEGLGTISNAYVAGIVCQVDSYNSNYSSITYWISDDGTTNNKLEVYSGKGIDGADFSSINDIQVDDIVVVTGTLKKYNSTYEFDYNNQLVSLVRPERPEIDATAGSALAYDATTGSIIYEIVNYVEGTMAATTTADWISNFTYNQQAEVGEVNFTVAPNTGASRTANVTLTYTYDTDKTVTAVVEVSQNGAPAVMVSPETLTVTADGDMSEFVITYTSLAITSASDFDVEFFESDGTTTATKPSWIGETEITASTTGESYDLIVEINANTETQRFAYFKVFAMDDNGVEKYSNLVTITQSAPVFTTIDLRGTTEPVIFNAGDFISSGSGYQSYSDVTYTGSNNVNYSGWNLYNVMHSNSNMQLKANVGSVEIPTIKTDYGFTITVVKTGDNDVSINNGEESGINTLTTTDTEADITIEADNGYAIISTITITPLAPPAEYNLTVSNLSHVNLFIFGGDESESIINTEEGETTAQVTNGTNIEISVDVEAGYVLQSLVVDGNDVTDQITDSDMYLFTMPAHDVTVTATAVEAPATDDFELFSGNLVEGDYIIYYNGKAMKNTVTSSRLDYSTIVPTNDVISTNDATIVWHIAPSGDYWTIYNAAVNMYAASTGGDNKAQLLSNGTDDKALWTTEDAYEFVNKFNSENGKNCNLRNNGTYGFACYSTTTGGALSLYKKVEPTPAGVTMEIAPDQWYLIASPVGNVDIDDVDNLTSGNHGLYSFDQTGGGENGDGKEWRNYKADAFSQLQAGKGYLYINQEGCILTFTGTANNNSTAQAQLVYSTSNETESFHGLNLIGNPLNATAYLEDGRPFYVMNGNVLAAANRTNIAPMEGVFVVAENASDNSVTFTTTQPTNGDKGVVLNLSQNRGSLEDRAIVRFGEGSQLPKVQLFETNADLYIPQGDQNYAVVRSEGQGELPVNFRASENGTYTLSMDVENMDMNYLHLIDNMTGMDIDLLQTPSYTFEAKVNDYESRFRLVFAANNEDGVSTGSTAFAFYSNGSWIINNAGEATLQVVDLTGRILSSETVNGSVSKTINAVPGVYMLRLINGDNVNVQKIVVR